MATHSIDQTPTIQHLDPAPPSAFSDAAGSPRSSQSSSQSSSESNRPAETVEHPFTVAILTDMHGNLDALNAVIEDVQSQDVNRIVVGGDLALFGPEPAECIDRVRELNAEVIRGNTDVYIAETEKDPWASDPRAQWVRDRIGEDRRAYLASLPFDCRVLSPDVQPAPPHTELLIVHATPTNVEGNLILEQDPFGDREVTSPEEAENMLANVMASLICYGHIHYASEGLINGRRVVSVGAVGFPFDGDQRAAYALCHWDGTDWTVEHRRVGYAVDAVIEKVARCGAPFAEIAAERLRQARFVGMPASKK